MTVVIEATGAGNLDDAIEELLSLIESDFEELSFAEVLNSELGKLQTLHGEFFTSAESPNGEKWAPLAPSTVAKKGHSTILVDSTDLRSSLGGRSGDSVREVVDEGPGRTGLAFGTDLPYSVFQATETANKPAREHVGFTGEYLDDAASRVADHAVEGLRDA